MINEDVLSMLDSLLNQASTSQGSNKGKASHKDTSSELLVGKKNEMSNKLHSKEDGWVTLFNDYPYLKEIIIDKSTLTSIRSNEN